MCNSFFILSREMAWLVADDAVGVFMERLLVLSMWCRLNLSFVFTLSEEDGQINLSLVFTIFLLGLVVCRFAIGCKDQRRTRIVKRPIAAMGEKIPFTTPRQAPPRQMQSSRSGAGLHSKKKKQAIIPTPPRYPSPCKMPPQSSTASPTRGAPPRPLHVPPLQLNWLCGGIIHSEEKKQVSRSTPPFRANLTNQSCGFSHGEEKDQPSRLMLPKHKVPLEICEPVLSSHRLCASQPCCTVLEFCRSPSAPTRDRPMWDTRAAEMVRSFSDEPKLSRPHATSTNHIPSRHISPSQHRQRPSPPQQVAQAKPRVAHLSSSSKYYAEVIKRQSEKCRAGMLGAPLCKNLPKKPEKSVKATPSQSWTPLFA